MTILQSQIKDCVSGGLALVWQRQIMFAGAALLAGYIKSVTEIAAKNGIRLGALINHLLDVQKMVNLLVLVLLFDCKVNNCNCY